jgi:hypothetical protein
VKCTKDIDALLCKITMKHVIVAVTVLDYHANAYLMKNFAA